MSMCKVCALKMIRTLHFPDGRSLKGRCNIRVYVPVCVCVCVCACVRAPMCVPPFPPYPAHTLFSKKGLEAVPTQHQRRTEKDNWERLPPPPPQIRGLPKSKAREIAERNFPKLLFFLPKLATKDAPNFPQLVSSNGRFVVKKALDRTIDNPFIESNLARGNSFKCFGNWEQSAA